MDKLVDGFWLPRSVRKALLTGRTEYATLSFARGQQASVGEEGAVTARWPILEAGDWERLLAALEANRTRAPRGEAFWTRFEAALPRAAQRLADPSDPLHGMARDSLPAYTGYSDAMIGATLGAFDLWALDQFPAALRLVPAIQSAARWQPMGDLPGYLRFYPTGLGQRLAAHLPGPAQRPLFGGASPPERVIGYAAGNVPGTALLITFLALSTTLSAGGPPPLVVVKNSRREPILAPLLLEALEAVDPDLASTTALLIWDYADGVVQDRVLRAADLVIAAAGDDTIAQIGASLARAAGSRAPGARAAHFHQHGHKVSFSAVGRDVLGRGQTLDPEGTPLVDVVSLLAALDSVFWDQHGCLSSRIHFVEEGSAATHTPLEYAERLVRQLGLLAPALPRGAWPRRRLHDRFDRYKLLEQAGQVRVLSAYDDPFVVILDRRPLDAQGFTAQVNECEGRVIVVRPVADLMEVPERYLKMVPPGHLQSLSVAVGRAGEDVTARFLRFAEACGARGVTAIRTVGRGAFPQIAYSWDGLIPLDLVRRRPEGHFTTIEFDTPYDDLVATYRLFLQNSSW
ncbi:MAG: hypothetical protein JXA93_11645 [Anaerolineae bacterium]|nr:hypothetical protein [Anaerolineae bacterium]